jgi:hypothetical protein
MKFFMRMFHVLGIFFQNKHFALRFSTAAEISTSVNKQ